jgi:hypothetical protein
LTTQKVSEEKKLVAPVKDKKVVAEEKEAKKQNGTKS